MNKIHTPALVGTHRWARNNADFPRPQADSIPYSDFLRYIEQSKIANVMVADTTISGELKGNDPKNLSRFSTVEAQIGTIDFTAKIIDSEVRHILEEGFETARIIIQKNQTFLNSGVEHLLKTETIEKAELGMSAANDGSAATSPKIKEISR